MKKERKFVERSIVILILIIVIGSVIDIELELLSALIIYSGIVNLGYFLISVSSTKKG